MATNPEDRPSKRDAFLAFLREGWASLHLDARRAGVVVPDDFRREPHLVLQYGRNMPIPIPDLQVTEDGVSATLSFQRNPFPTHVPWSAVYVVACTDGRGVLYYEDVPPEVSLSLPPPDATPPERNDRATPTRHLQSVPAEPAPAEELDEAAADAPKRRRKPTLRLVK